MRRGSRIREKKIIEGEVHCWRSREGRRWFQRSSLLAKKNREFSGAGVSSLPPNFFIPLDIPLSQKQEEALKTDICCLLDLLNKFYQKAKKKCNSGEGKGIGREREQLGERGEPELLQFPGRSIWVFLFMTPVSTSIKWRGMPASASFSFLCFVRFFFSFLPGSVSSQSLDLGPGGRESSSFDSPFDKNQRLSFLLILFTKVSRVLFLSGLALDFQEIQRFRSQRTNNKKRERGWFFGGFEKFSFLEKKKKEAPFFHGSGKVWRATTGNPASFEPLVNLRGTTFGYFRDFCSFFFREIDISRL